MAREGGREGGWWEGDLAGWGCYFILFFINAFRIGFPCSVEKVRAKIAILKMDKPWNESFFFFCKHHIHTHTCRLTKWEMGLKEKGKEKEAR